MFPHRSRVFQWPQREESKNVKFVREVISRNILLRIPISTVISGEKICKFHSNSKADIYLDRSKLQCLKTFCNQFYRELE